MRIFTLYLFFQCVFNDFQCVITLLRALSVALPATKTQDPREVHDQDITGKDTNPFSEGRET